MRRDRRKVLSWLIWRERLRGIGLWSLPAVALLLGLTAYIFDPPVPALHERGTVLHARQKQGQYSGSFPYLVIQRPDGSVVSVSIDNRGTHKTGQEVCVQILRGLLFGRQRASLADERECRR